MRSLWHQPLDESDQGIAYRTMNYAELREEITLLARHRADCPRIRELGHRVRPETEARLTLKIEAATALLTTARRLGKYEPEYPRWQFVPRLAQCPRNLYDEYFFRCESVHHDHQCDQRANHAPPCRCKCLDVEWRRAEAHTGAFGECCMSQSTIDTEAA